LLAIPDAALSARFLRFSSSLKRNLSFLANSSSSRLKTCPEARRLTSASRLFSVRCCCSCTFCENAPDVDKGALTVGYELPVFVLDNEDSELEDEGLLIDPNDDGLTPKGEKDCLGLFKDSFFVNTVLVRVPKELLDPIGEVGFGSRSKGENDCLGLFKDSFPVDDVLVGVSN